MNVAVTARGAGLDAQVDPRFGRAAQFLVYDTETGDWRMLDNKQNVHAAQGAGIQAATTVNSAGVAAVLTGHCGPRAFQALQAAGVSVYTGVSGTIREALDRLAAGSLAASDAASVESHHGMGL